MTAEKLNDASFDFPHVSEVVMASERLIFNTTEDILLAMQDAAMSQADLAKKLGRSKAYVSQFLDGTRNMTLKTLSDITYALGAEVKLAIMRDGRDVSHVNVPELIERSENEHYFASTAMVETSGTKTIKVYVAAINMDSVANATY